MKTVLLIFILAGIYQGYASAQNVGIGTNTPATDLHIVNTSIATLRIETSTSVSSSGIELKTNPAAPYNLLQMIKWSNSAGGSVSGINLSGLSEITTGTSTTGGLLIGTLPAQPLYFTTNNAVRMQINEAGEVGIGDQPLFGNRLLIDGGGGKALTTIGQLQLSGIGEGSGKILTSDAAGNATWQNAGASHNHYGQSWSGSAANGLQVTNLFSGDFNIAIAGYSTNAAAANAKGVVGSVESPTGIGVYGSNGTGTTFPSPAPNSGVSGVAGTGIGVAGLSYSGAGVYGSSTDGNAVQGFKGNTNGNAGYFQLTSAASANAALKAEAAGNTALELNNGFIKVSGTNKTAFTVTANASNSSGHILSLSYNNPLNTDIVMVTHNYNPPGGSTNYLSSPYSVFWTGAAWAIYLDDIAPILGKSFNVLVIKQ